MDKYHILRQSRLFQEKYIYYLIAISVTAIGFSVRITSGEGFKLSFIFLGLSVMFWSIGVFCGLWCLKKNISYTKRNANLINEQDKLKIPEVETDIGKKLDDVIYFSMMDRLYNKNENWFKAQQILFFLGLILFILHYLYQMHLNTCY